MHRKGYRRHRNPAGMGGGALLLLGGGAAVAVALALSKKPSANGQPTMSGSFGVTPVSGSMARMRPGTAGVAKMLGMRSGVGAINLGGVFWREIQVSFNGQVTNPSNVVVTVTPLLRIYTEDITGRLQLGSPRVSITLNPGESLPFTLNSQPGQVVETVRAGNVVALVELHLVDVNGPIVQTIDAASVLAVIEALAVGNPIMSGAFSASGVTPL